MSKKAAIRRLPLWAVFTLDLLLAAMGLCLFSYFHHVRVLWGSAEEAVLYHIDKPSGVVSDFGDRFPEVFLPEGQSELTENTYKSHDVSVTLTQHDVKTKNGPVRYFVFDVYVRNLENLYVSYSTGKRIPLEELSSRGGTLYDAGGETITLSGAIAAVNGDYMGNRNRTLVAVRNGDVLRKSRYIQADLCVMYYDGVVETVSPKEYDWEKIEKRAPYQVWNFGPSLLDEDGRALPSYSVDNYDSYVVDSLHPRTAFGYYEPGHYCFVMVDGRSDVSVGVDMVELAEIMESLDCAVAYNMDGGDSALGSFDGRPVRVDQERDETGVGQRALYDVICIGEILAPEEEEETK